MSKQRALKLHRSTFKRYLDTGWMPKSLAGSLMTRETVRTFAHGVSAGVYESRKDTNDNTEVRTEDVLMLIGKNGEELLAEMFPPKRLHKGQCRQAAGNLATKLHREAFARSWHRVHDHFAKLIGSPHEDVGARELRLFHVVMALSWRARSFRLCLNASDLHRLTGLDYDYLPKARRRLELWGLLTYSQIYAGYVS